MSIKIVPIQIKKSILVSKKEPVKVEKMKSKDEVFVSEIAKMENGEQILEHMRHYLAIEYINKNEILETTQNINEKIIQNDDSFEEKKENKENKNLKI